MTTAQRTIALPDIPALMRLLDLGDEREAAP
jgi:hypothetical protein